MHHTVHVGCKAEQTTWTDSNHVCKSKLLQLLQSSTVMGLLLCTQAVNVNWPNSAPFLALETSNVKSRQVPAIGGGQQHRLRGVHGWGSRR